MRTIAFLLLTSFYCYAVDGDSTLNDKNKLEPYKYLQKKIYTDNKNSLLYDRDLAEAISHEKSFSEYLPFNEDIRTKKIKSALKALNKAYLTQADIANCLGVSQSTVSRFLGNHNSKKLVNNLITLIETEAVKEFKGSYKELTDNPHLKTLRVCFEDKEVKEDAINKIGNYTHLQYMYIYNGIFTKDNLKNLFNKKLKYVKNITFSQCVLDNQPLQLRDINDNWLEGWKELKAKNLIIVPPSAPQQDKNKKSLSTTTDLDTSISTRSSNEGRPLLSTTNKGKGSYEKKND